MAKFTAKQKDGDNVDDKARKLVWDDKVNYEDASRQIRAILKKSYRNYLSIFDEPKTRYTNMTKVFVPLTKWHCNTIAARIKVDASSITVRPREEGDVGKAMLFEKILDWVMDRMRFTNEMRRIARYKTIMGTAVVAVDWDYKRKKFYQKMPKSLMTPLVDGFKRMTGRKPEARVIEKEYVEDRPRVKLIDLLDVYIDPTAESIQTAQSVIIRSVHPLDAVKNNKMFKNTENLKGTNQIPEDTYNSTSLTQYATRADQEIRTEVKMIELWERYGEIDLSWVTGEKKDEGKMTEGIITVAGPSHNESAVLSVRLLPFNNCKRPLEEDFYDKVPNRWYGEGVAEKLLDVQREINRVVNQRIENERVLQNPMFKFKIGSGISRSDLMSRPAGGIAVNSMDDIEQLVVTDIRESSFVEENNLLGMAQQITGAFDIVRGQEQEASKAATTSAIEAQNAGNLFEDLKAETNDFIRRVFEDHIIPYVIQFMDSGTVVRISGRADELAEIDQMLGNDAKMAKQLGRYRFIDIENSNVLDAPYDLEVDIDASIPNNRAVQSKQLLDGIQLAMSLAQNGQGMGLVMEMFQLWFELQGFPTGRFERVMEEEMTQPAVPQGQMGQPSAPTEQELVQQSQTPQTMQGMGPRI